MKRRLLSGATLLALCMTSVHGQKSPQIEVELPRDAGAHPEASNEWWYLTGWLSDAHGVARGFQVTFFRVRNRAPEDNPSKFAPRELLFAHAALSDPQLQKLLRGERAARAGFTLAEAQRDLLNVRIDDWSLTTHGTNYATTISTDAFALQLELQPTQPALLHGDSGISRKGPDGHATSHYYSIPQIAVRGKVSIGGREIDVKGRAWFDHEWSDNYLDVETVGWDWLGINLEDGGALMAFRMRDATGRQRWAAATLRTRAGTQAFGPTDVAWTPLRRWRSPRTGIEYPIEWRVTIGQRALVFRPLMADQENDARGSVGILYWEGAVSAHDSSDGPVGHGYLELTGYGERVNF